MKKITIIAIVASIIGFIDSAYLTIIKFTNSPIYCTPGLGNCESVQNSQWSTIWGIPIALLGALAYLFLIFCFVFEQSIPDLKRYSDYLVFGTSFFGFLYSLYLTYLELFVLQAICQWCILSAICMTVVFITTIIRLKEQQLRTSK
ncbi:MAG: vitamin K epoxide reductase family protein [Anaerolineaceae bacterium]|nr:vitamin K epoxide reductase family protein [Anaerolineaceae bacterium]